MTLPEQSGSDTVACPFCKRHLDDPCETAEDLRYCAFTPPTTAPIGLRQDGQYLTTLGFRK